MRGSAVITTSRLMMNCTPMQIIRKPIKPGQRHHARCTSSRLKRSAPCSANHERHRDDQDAGGNTEKSATGPSLAWRSPARTRLITTANVPGPLRPGMASGVKAMSYLISVACSTFARDRGARKEHAETEERHDHAAGDAHARHRDAEEVHDQATRDEEPGHEREGVDAGAADLPLPLGSAGGRRRS